MLGGDLKGVEERCWIVHLDMNHITCEILLACELKFHVSLSKVFEAVEVK